MSRLPNKVITKYTDQIRSRATELLSGIVVVNNFDQYKIFVTDTKRGRTSPSHKTITVPKWAIVDPSAGRPVIKLRYTGPLLERFWIYYLAHELAHAATDDMTHGPKFMKKFLQICPTELQFFEIGYKPRRAAAAGISQ